MIRINLKSTLNINCPHLVTVSKCTYEITFYFYSFKYMNRPLGLEWQIARKNWGYQRGNFSKKDIQPKVNWLWSRKHYTEYLRSCNGNLTKNQRWTQVLTYLKWAVNILKPNKGENVSFTNKLYATTVTVKCRTARTLLVFYFDVTWLGVKLDSLPCSFPVLRCIYCIYVIILC